MICAFRGLDWEDAHLDNRWQQISLVPNFSGGSIRGSGIGRHERIYFEVPVSVQGSTTAKMGAVTVADGQSYNRSLPNDVLNLC